MNEPETNANEPSTWQPPDPLQAPDEESAEQHRVPACVGDFVEGLIAAGIIPDGRQIFRVVIDADYHAGPAAPITIHVLTYADQRLPRIVAALIGDADYRMPDVSHVLWRCPRCYRESALTAGRCTGCGRDNYYIDIDADDLLRFQQSYGTHLCVECLVCACGHRERRAREAQRAKTDAKQS
ncbi:MAG: hypothetical protein GY778_13495 [bacterium]|nr:hypothetical protein [bacterium]